MEAKTIRSEFCSDKCRVYWNREGKKENKEPTTFTPNVSLTSLKEPKKEIPEDIQSKIDYYESEKAKLKEGSLANSMRYSYDKKIAELKHWANKIKQ